MMKSLGAQLLLVVWLWYLGAVARGSEEAGSMGGEGLGMLARALDKCGRWSELGTCLRVKTVTLLDRALKGGPLVINDYLSLAPDPSAVDAVAGPNLSESDLEAVLPKDQDEKDSALDDMIADKMTSFISSRSLRFNVPTGVFEGRKKSGGGGGGGGGGGKKGGGMMMMAAMAMGGMMIQMAMAKIALLAGKALLIGKLALLLSAIIALKKLVGGGGGGESHQVVYATEAHGGGGGGGHGWGRSAAAHDLAYSAQARANARK